MIRTTIPQVPLAEHWDLWLLVTLHQAVCSLFFSPPWHDGTSMVGSVWIHFHFHCFIFFHMIHGHWTNISFSICLGNSSILFPTDNGGVSPFLQWDNFLVHSQETVKFASESLSGNSQGLSGLLFCLGSPVITAPASKLGYSTVYLIPQCYLLAFFCCTISEIRRGA